jgi:hypothetical protein
MSTIGGKKRGAKDEWETWEDSQSEGQGEGKERNGRRKRRLQEEEHQYAFEAKEVRKRRTTGKEEHRRCDLRRQPIPPQGIKLTYLPQRPALLRPLERDGCHVRLDKSRGDRAHANTGTLQLLGGGLGEVDDGGLACAVRQGGKVSDKSALFGIEGYKEGRERTSSRRVQLRS